MQLDDLANSVGLGLRAPHYQDILAATFNDQKKIAPWFEVLIDNYLGAGGTNYQVLEAMSQQYPISFHGVNLNLGGIDPLDKSYLQLLKSAIQAFNPIAVSEHACFTAFNGNQAHDLLPLPFTQAAADNLAQRVMQTQDFLGQQILIENVSRYIDYPATNLEKKEDMDEADLLTYVAHKADCFILLDINNAYVNQINHGIDYLKFLHKLPPSRIKEVHLAGHELRGSLLVDTHNNLISKKVWDCYADFCHFSRQHKITTPTLIEWDSDIPELSILLEEKSRAEKIIQHSKNQKIPTSEGTC